MADSNRELSEKQVKDIKKAARTGFEAACTEVNVSPKDFTDYEGVVRDIEDLYLDSMRSVLAEK